VSSRFIDLVTIEVRAGRGGHGIVSFRREAHIPRGGPNGGDGGRGGSVRLVVDPKLVTLADIRNGSVFRATSGEPGGGANRTGKGGKDNELTVPPGTMVYDADTGELLVDMTEPGQVYAAAAGGAPGRGNASFTTSTNRAPRVATKGEPGETRRLRLELRLIADAGMVGVPNAGKSTILATVTAARPKVAGYPFTTLHPGLGLVRRARGFSFVLADLPGLIEGASEGAGLGLRFLRHVHRNRILVYILGAGLPLTPLEQYRTVRGEIEAHGGTDLEKIEEITVLSKTDLLDQDGIAAALAELPPDTLAISAATGAGIDELLARLSAAVVAARRAEAGE